MALGRFLDPKNDLAFNREFKKKKNELTNIIEKWAYFLKNARKTEEEDLESIIGSDLIIRRAYDEISQYAWTPEELRYYDSIDMKHSANQATLEGARTEGKAEGKAEGIKLIRPRFPGHLAKRHSVPQNVLG